MKTWTTHHPCPYDEICDDDVAVTYDCGRGPDDFYRVEDELACGKGHKVPAGIAESWVDKDMARYADYLYDKYDEAREALYERKGDR